MYKITFVTSVFDNTYNLKKVEERLLLEKLPIEISFLSTHDLDKDHKLFLNGCQKSAASDFVFICCHGGFHHFKKHKMFIEYLNSHQVKCFFESGIQDDMDEFSKKSGITQSEYQKIYAYFVMRDEENLYRMMFYLAYHFGYIDVEVQPVLQRKWQGIYPIDTDMKNIFELKGSIIGILFHIHDYMNHDTRHIDAMIRHIEEAGGIAVPLYTHVVKDTTLGSEGVYGLVDALIDENGSCALDVLINVCSYSMSIMGQPSDGTRRVEKSLFRRLNIPIIKAITTFENRETWETSIIGVDTMTLISNIHFPEFDGQIIGVPVATKEMHKDAYGTRYVHMPIDDRIHSIVTLAMNWTKLRHKKNSEKKIAIILHNMPPRNDMIGCAHGLDTPQSLHHVIKHLKTMGIQVDNVYDDGQTVIQQIIQGLTNETSWLSSKEVHTRAIDEVSKGMYQQWFELLDSSVQDKLIMDWGTPPGEFMVHDESIPIPGILNGHVFIGLQPPRALDEQAEACYHSTDIVCPHQYIAFYKWLKYVYQADLVLHVGTHGTVEWLPGKEKGLSKACYPDICMHDFPHLYIYHVGVTGEGLQAKRRSKATLLSHSIPSLQESKAYGDIEEIEALMDEFRHSKKLNNKKLPIIKEQIWQAVCVAHLHKDLMIEEDEAMKNFDEFLERLHIWLGKIKHSLISDGLHIFGQPLTGKRLRNQLRSLVRIPVGQIQPLNAGIALSLGYDYQLLLDEPLKIWTNGQNSLQIIDDIIEEAESLMKKLEACDYDLSDWSMNETLYETLEFICKEIKPKVDGITDELRFLENGIMGGFVEESPSGNPTRGRLDILPTGRNFYGIDPRMVPSKGAWRTGVTMAKQLLDRYLEDEGVYPESIAIVVYSGETMKTQGDDIAQMLYLMGIAPVWFDGSDQIKSLEVIPVKVLGRPRIDVIARISGLFRDTFPNVIDLLDDAIRQVASLDERDEDNYIKKHVEAEVRSLLEKGVDIETAYHDAALRIFGCPPGGYGAGTDIAIGSKKWETSNDIGQMFIQWSSHAYGGQHHGTKMSDQFKNRLGEVSLTVKNESSVEIDMLDSDDFFVYHGGLIAAVTTIKGTQPNAYVGQSADPDRPELMSLNEETARIMRGRILNPKWFEGLKEHGYKGAQEVSAMIDYIFGWDATSHNIKDWMYESVTQEFVLKQENREWLEKNNPYAIHYMTERLLEAIQRNMWQASGEMKEALVRIYLETEGALEGE